MRRPFPVLRTARLELRPYAPADVEALHELFTHPDVRRFMFDEAVVDRAWIEEEVASTRASWRRNGWGQLALRLVGRRAVIGFCGLRPLGRPREPELLYGLHPVRQGRGLATEAASAVVRYAFEESRFDCVRASTALSNRASQRVMRRLGMELGRDGSRVRGTLPRSTWTFGGEPFSLRWEGASASL